MESVIISLLMDIACKTHKRLMDIWWMKMEHGLLMV